MTEIVAGLVLVAGVAFALVVRFAGAGSDDSDHDSGSGSGAHLGGVDDSED